MNSTLPAEDRTTNSFADSFIVALVMTTGFIVAATGITITSLSVSIAGLVILLGSVGLYGRMVE